MGPNCLPMKFTYIFTPGSFQPSYCPGYNGCRERILFDITGETGNMNLTDLDVKIVFNNTGDKEIWLVSDNFIELFQRSQSSTAGNIKDLGMGVCWLRPLSLSED